MRALAGLAPRALAPAMRATQGRLSTAPVRRAAVTGPVIGGLNNTDIAGMNVDNVASSAVLTDGI